MTLEKHIAGEEKKYGGGTFYLVERTLEELGRDSVYDYIRANRDTLLMKSIRRRFPELAHIPRNRMLFLDIENCGLEIDSPIISIALAHMNSTSGIKLECLFARDYSEEKAILKYFLDIVPNYEAFFTYNGKSFDAPRLRERAIHNGLYDPSIKNLCGLIGSNGDKGKTSQESDSGNNHHDFFHLCRQAARINLADAKLKTIEKTLPELGHFRRQDDIASADIPKVYFEYVYGRKRKTRKVIADRELWRKCLERAEAFDYPNLPQEQREQVARGYAQRLYEGAFKDMPFEDELRGVKGAYKEEYYPGERINEDERRRDMARLIHHNILDVRTLIGILCYLCSPVSQQSNTIGKELLPF